MQLKHALGSLAVALSLGTMATGCLVTGSAHARIAEPVAVVEVDEEPPPPRQVVVETRPGFIWIEGRWVRNGRQWVWNDGRWERERAGYVWEQGRWETRGRGHVWVEGRWRAGGAVAPAGPVVRDHREERREERREDGPAVRDHRH